VPREAGPLKEKAVEPGRVITNWWRVYPLFVRNDIREAKHHKIGTLSIRRRMGNAAIKDSPNIEKLFQPLPPEVSGPSWCER
jgi:hypothetical protein